MTEKSSPNQTAHREIFIYNNKSIRIKYEIDDQDESKKAVEVNGKKRNEINELSEFNNDLEEYAFSLQRDYYTEFLSQSFENLVILTGAGTSKV